MSNKGLKRNIRRAFDPHALRDMCEREPEDFAGYGAMVPTADGAFYVHRDIGAPVLAVAHLDTVQSDRRCKMVHTPAGWVALSGALDDRLGAYIILDMLPQLGIAVDVLLTTNEEIGDSTAQDFVANHGYNWVVEFDRMGTDTVLYQYDTPSLRRRLKDLGGQVGIGSFSDICYLDDLGVAAMNMGVGYHDYHTLRGHAYLSDTFRMVNLFARFHAMYADERIPYVREVHRPRVVNEVTYGSFDDWYVSRSLRKSAGKREHVVSYSTDWDQCPECQDQLVSGTFCPTCAVDWDGVDAEVMARLTGAPL